jgi:hypothetical protein
MVFPLFRSIVEVITDPETGTPDDKLRQDGPQIPLSAKIFSFSRPDFNQCVSFKPFAGRVLTKFFGLC